MKCKNCGGNFPSRELRCPYCGAENTRGRLWKQQRDRADRDLETARREDLPTAKKLALHKVLNRILLAELILIALFALGLFATFFLTDAGLFNGTLFGREKIDAELQALYDAGDFDRLYQRLEETDSFDQEHYTLCQMALIYRDYEAFCITRTCWFQETEEKDISEYTAAWLVDHMHDLFYCDIPAYPELTDQNAAILAEYQQDAALFARHILRLTEEEMALLQKQDWMYSEEEDALAAAILERGLCHEP